MELMGKENAWFMITEYAAYHRKHDKLARLLVGRDESICPKLLLLSARVSCIIDKKDGKHLDRAVNMLWQLYDVIAISIEFEGFGLLLLDLLTVKIFVEMAELDGKDDRKIVDDVMKLFKIPNDIKHLNQENRAWIQEKYESFSRNFVHLFLNEGKEHLVSEFDSMSKSSCSWDSIKQRVDMYLDEVNKKYGPTFLDLFIRDAKEEAKEKSRNEQTGTQPSTSGTRWESLGDELLAEIADQHQQVSAEPSTSSAGRSHNTFEGKEILNETATVDCTKNAPVQRKGKSQDKQRSAEPSTSSAGRSHNTFEGRDILNETATVDCRRNAPVQRKGKSQDKQRGAEPSTSSAGRSPNTIESREILNETATVDCRRNAPVQRKGKSQDKQRGAEPSTSSAGRSPNTFESREILNETTTVDCRKNAPVQRKGKSHDKQRGAEPSTSSAGRSPNTFESREILNETATVDCRKNAPVQRKGKSHDKQRGAEPSTSSAGRSPNTFEGKEILNETATVDCTKNAPVQRKGKSHDKKRGAEPSTSSARRSPNTFESREILNETATVDCRRNDTAAKSKGKGRDKRRGKGVGRTINASKRKKVLVETARSNCEEDTPATDTDDVNMNAEISFVGSFDQLNIDEELQSCVLSGRVCPCCSVTEEERQKYECASPGVDEPLDVGSYKEAIAEPSSSGTAGNITLRNKDKSKQKFMNEFVEIASVFQDAVRELKMKSSRDRQELNEDRRENEDGVETYDESDCPMVNESIDWLEEMSDFSYDENDNICSIEDTECTMFSKEKSKQDGGECNSAPQDVVKAVNEGSCKDMNDRKDNEVHVENYDADSDSSMLSECFEEEVNGNKGMHRISRDENNDAEKSSINNKDSAKKDVVGSQKDRSVSMQTQASAAATASSQTQVSASASQTFISNLLADFTQQLNAWFSKDINNNPRHADDIQNKNIPTVNPVATDVRSVADHPVAVSSDTAGQVVTIDNQTYLLYPLPPTDLSTNNVRIDPTNSSQSAVSSEATNPSSSRGKPAQSQGNKGQPNLPKGDVEKSLGDQHDGRHFNKNQEGEETVSSSAKKTKATSMKAPRRLITERKQEHKKYPLNSSHDHFGSNDANNSTLIGKRRSTPESDAQFPPQLSKKRKISLEKQQVPVQDVPRGQHNVRSPENDTAQSNQSSNDIQDVCKTTAVKARKPTSPFTLIQPRNTSSSPKFGESRNVRDKTDTQSGEGRTSPSIFDYLRPNSLTQDENDCPSLGKNRWSSTGESSKSRKSSNAVGETEASKTVLSGTEGFGGSETCAASNLDSDESYKPSSLDVSESSENFEASENSQNSSCESGENSEISNFWDSESSETPNFDSDKTYKPSNFRSGESSEKSSSFKPGDNSEISSESESSEASKPESSETSKFREIRFYSDKLRSHKAARSMSSKKRNHKHSSLESSETHVRKKFSVWKQSRMNRLRSLEGRALCRCDEEKRIEKTSVRSLREKPRSSKRRRLMGSAITSSYGTVLEEEDERKLSSKVLHLKRNCNLDAIVELVKLKVEYLL